ncbi:MAG: hypothetical protein JO053_10835 [Acidobacteria bacterium]|nr:hypothetical protein [Acidobacteriota bacterium]
MNLIDDIRESLSDEWLPAIYQHKVRSDRTRSIKIEVPKKENSADIQYTLLGIELKVGRRRFACPDLATARYLRVFARIGCQEVALPYDITKISPIADELETSWQRTLILCDKAARTEQSVRSRVIKTIREEINKIGPGEAMPLFDRETKQRKA